MRLKNVALTILLTLGVQQASAYTVCSMTLNSPDEIEVIKKSLGTDKFDYVEMGNQPEKFCKTRVSCDVVVMSGHFGGLFFGDKGDYSLESMEKLSCDSKCGNLFANAKHVYLFGCNTLNGKNKDRRTPEQYVQVLREDHYYLAAAQQMSANIYSEYGDTYHNRMQHVFPKATKIYGFNSIAPSGKNVRSSLTKVFGAWKGDYARALENTDLEQKWTQDLSQQMKIFAFTTATGKPLSESVTCQIMSNRREIDQLRVIRSLIEKGEGMKVAPILIDFFRLLPVNALDRNEKAELEKIKSNSAAKEKFMAFITNSSDAFTVVRLDLLRMMAKIEWVSQNEAAAISKELVTRVLVKQNLNPEYLKTMYAARELSGPDFRSFSRDAWMKPDIYQVVDYFGTKDTYVAEQIANAMGSSNDIGFLRLAGSALVKLNKSMFIDKLVQRTFNNLESSSSSAIRSLARELKTQI